MGQECRGIVKSNRKDIDWVDIMKILIYENTSGFSSYTHKLCNALYHYSNSDEIVYVTSTDNDYIKNVDSNIRIVNILKTYSTKEKNSIQWMFNRIWVSLQNILIRNKIVRQEKPDVISIQCTIPVIDRYLFGKMKKYAKVVYTVHDVIPPIKSFYWSISSLKSIYHQADHLVVHTNGNQEDLIREFGIDISKISVIHHGTDINYRKLDKTICRKEIGILDNKPTVLFYGLIRPQKGLDILIEALKGLDANLVIAGAMPTGENFEKYEKCIKDAGIKSYNFIEFVSEEFTEKLYQGCDWVVLPYRYFYSQSGVFMQSIQYRKPVIATDVSSFQEYLEKYQFGLLCKSNDVSDLHEKMKYAFSHPDLQEKFSVNAEQAAIQNSWDKSADLHNQLFKKILKLEQDEINCF